MVEKYLRFIACSVICSFSSLEKTWINSADSVPLR